MGKKLSTEKFIENAKKVHGDRYDYSKVDYKDARTKICIICPEHGEFWQTPDCHIHGSGCATCGGRGEMTTEKFIEKARLIHGNKYDYSKVRYINNKTKVCIICPEHGEFWQVPIVHLRGGGCSFCVGKKMNRKMFIEKAQQVHGGKYDYSKVEYINNKTKVCIICPEHGEFWQKPGNHLRGQNCPKCTNEYNYTNEEWIERACGVHGKMYDYSKTNYTNCHTKVCVTCSKHGDFWIYPSNHLHGHGCPKCRLSKLEKMIMDILNKNNIHFIYNQRFDWLKNRKPLTLDFYLPEYNIAIECQGEQHLIKDRNFKNQTNETYMKNDVLKNKLCEENGVKLFYFAENDINEININNSIYTTENYYTNRHILIETITSKKI